MNEPDKRRPIRSYVLRAGRMTEGQQRAYDENWRRIGLLASDGSLDYRKAFGRDAPVVLEIGFGMGDSLVEMAAAAPDKNFIGVEVHRPGVGKLLHGMVTSDIDNIRVYCHDAVQVLKDCIAADSLDDIACRDRLAKLRRADNGSAVCEPASAQYRRCWQLRAQAGTPAINQVRATW